MKNTKRKDKYELIDEIMSANEKGKIYVDEELQTTNIKCDTNHGTLYKVDDEVWDCFTCGDSFKLKVTN